MFQKWRNFLRKQWLGIILLLLCAALPYANTLVNGFVYDDNSQILENPYVRSFRYLREIFGTSVWSFAGTASRYYRPMMTFGYLLCYKAFGLSPAGFHLVNIALHTAVVWLILLVSGRMFGNRSLAFVAAGLFAIHPVHTESVDWIAAVTDLELTFFYLLTFWFYLAPRFCGNAIGLNRFAMLTSYALALFSKEQAVTLPILATIYEHFYCETKAHTRWGQKFWRYFPLWLLAAAYLPLRRFSLGGLVVTSNYWGLSPPALLFSALALIQQYLWKLLWPLNLSVFYVFRQSNSISDGKVLVGASCGLLILAVFWWLWKRARMASFGLIWLAVTLAPVLNARWMGLNVFAERYLYLPSVGFCWVAAWGLLAGWSALAGRRMIWRKAFVSAMGLIALFCSIRIITRNSDWHDDISLYTQTLEQSPDASLIRVNLATIYKNQGLLKQAESEYMEVLTRDPDCADCLNHFGRFLLEGSRYSQAEAVLKRAIRLDPANLSARLNLGTVYQRQAVTVGAEEQFRTAEALAPMNLRVQLSLGSFHEWRGDFSRAEAAFERALSINPYAVESHLALGHLYETEKRSADALREYQAVLKKTPENFEAAMAVRRLQGALDQ
jgi:protein O-mannosyl-transferase